MSDSHSKLKEKENDQTQGEPATGAGKKVWHTPTLEQIDYTSTETNFTMGGTSDMSVCS